MCRPGAQPQSCAALVNSNATLGSRRRRAGLAGKVASAVRRMGADELAERVVLCIRHCSLRYDAGAKGAAHEEIMIRRLLHTPDAAPCELGAGVLTREYQSTIGHLDLLSLGAVWVGFDR